MLTDVSLEQASHLAETIRAKVEALHQVRGRRVRRLVTVSIGLAVREAEQVKTLATLMEQADAAVYRAKSDGRNQVYRDDSSPARHVA